MEGPGEYYAKSVVGKLISQKSQMSTVHRLKFLLRANFFSEFLQRGRERDRKLETSMRENHRSAASCTPPTGEMPATKAHAPDRNRTRNLSVQRPTLYPLRQTSFGESQLFKLKLLTPFLQNRIAQAVVFCGGDTLKWPESHVAQEPQFADRSAK
uniref:Uncharacterized protein n=1 Tax=Pipistrellus kuhlii TaxID=59472 RepID=A0A7J7Y989_PIPKU|nr:hypothetical protein mPipKuh1_010353 [Pipistrellus kuhlii]